MTINVKYIITGNESCIYAYDQETTLQCSEYRAESELKPKKHIKTSQKKVNWPNS